LKNEFSLMLRKAWNWIRFPCTYTQDHTNNGKSTSRKCNVLLFILIKQGRRLLF